MNPNPARAFRILNALAAVGCFASLAVAYFFMEKYLLLEPCPLCILDRIVVAAMGVVFLALALRDSRATAAWAGTLANCVFLSAGFVFAARHIWLQNRPPDEAASCLSDSQAAESLIEIIRRAFDANADCGAIIWEDPVFGLTIPEQVMAMFVGFAALLVLQLFLLARIKTDNVSEANPKTNSDKVSGANPQTNPQTNSQMNPDMVSDGGSRR